jgi:hypothetical protein
MKNYCVITESTGRSAWTAVTRWKVIITGGLCGSCGNKALNCHISWLHYHIPQKINSQRNGNTLDIHNPKTLKIAPESRQMVTIYLDWQGILLMDWYCETLKRLSCKIQQTPGKMVRRSPTTAQQCASAVVWRVYKLVFYSNVPWRDRTHVVTQHSAHSYL